MSEVWILIVLSLALGLYNAYVMLKILNHVRWILRHVHIVSASNAADPEYTAIRKAFGITDDTDREE